MKGVRAIATKDIQDDINEQRDESLNPYIYHDRYHKSFFITNICQSWYNVGDLNKEVGASQINKQKNND